MSFRPMAYKTVVDTYMYRIYIVTDYFFFFLFFCFFFLSFHAYIASLIIP